MIDLHCHILPGIDDGPATMDDALELARTHLAAGVTCVAATSHVDWNWGNTAAGIAAGVDGVRAALAEADIPLEVVMGGEVAMTRAHDLSDAELHALRLGGGRHILLECPLSPGLVFLDRMVSHVQQRGHQVLLAHPERSPSFQKDPELLPRLVAGGALAQITAGALVGRFGEIVRTTALDMVTRGLVHVISSDAHDPLRRPPGLAGPLEEAGLGAMTAWWCEEVPRAILDGGPLPPAPPLPDVAPPAGRRGLFRRR